MNNLQASCNHHATVKFSDTMNIDKCIQCEGYLVWCVNGLHDVTKSEESRHWHFAETAETATALAAGPFNKFGSNLYGIARP